MPVTPGFVQADKTRKLDHVVALVYGEPKVGKDYFSIKGSPGPVDILNLDSGLEGLDAGIKGFATKVRVGGMPGSAGRYPSYAVPIIPKDEGLEYVRNIAMPIWTTFLTHYKAALRGDAKTVVVDTAGAAYDLALQAYVGSSSKVGPKDDPYQKRATAARRLFRSLALEAMRTPKNVIFIARATQVWEDNEPVKGLYKPEGWAGLPFEVMFSLFLHKTVWKGKPTYKARVTDSRIDQERVLGLSWEGADVNFSKIISDITETDQGDWL